MPRASSDRTRRKPESFYEKTLYANTDKGCVSVRSDASSRRAKCSNIEKSLSILEIVMFCRKNKNEKQQENAESACIRRFASRMLREAIIPPRNEREQMFLRGTSVADLY